jgi:ActR/RegA family two-component response regulator
VKDTERIGPKGIQHGYSAMEQIANHEFGPSLLIIVDDHPLFRSALRQVLSRHSGLEETGEADDGREAVGLCRRLHPKPAMMDVRMPQVVGLNATAGDVCQRAYSSKCMEGEGVIRSTHQGSV